MDIDPGGKFQETSPSLDPEGASALGEVSRSTEKADTGNVKKPWVFDRVASAMRQLVAGDGSVLGLLNRRDRREERSEWGLVNAEGRVVWSDGEWDEVK